MLIHCTGLEFSFSFVLFAFCFCFNVVITTFMAMNPKWFSSFVITFVNYFESEL